MSIPLKIIPRDSLIHNWLKIYSNTEVPRSYLIVTGLSVIGAMLRREVWVDQNHWKVFPNQSVMLIGPSGVGKDTAINFAQKVLEQRDIIPIIGGRTIEGLYHRLAMMGDPAAAYIPAGELTAYLGGRDYQKSMTNDLTNLLSTGEKMDISTKTDLVMTGVKAIKRPTVTMHCGSTAAWLHRAMPEGSLEGGFLGRFLIVIEDLGERFIPLPKYHILDADDRRQMKEASVNWERGLDQIIAKTQGVGEVLLLSDAEYHYQNWYNNRFKLFSKATVDYANRSRDTVLRMAMLMAFTRGHYQWMDKIDVQFGIDVLAHVARGIDRVVLPPTKEAQAAEEIMKMLPASHKDIVRTLGRKYELRMLQSAETLLEVGGQMKRVGEKFIKEF